MPRPLQIEIGESEDTLKRLLRQQSSGRRKERLQALYWLKSGQVTTRMELATLTSPRCITGSNCIKQGDCRRC